MASPLTVIGAASRLAGVAPKVVIDRVAADGLQFDPARGTGVVLHMLSCLAIDGRFGLTAIGRDAEHAAELYEATRRAAHQAKAAPVQG